jgi:hypothetical protein
MSRNRAERLNRGGCIGAGGSARFLSTFQSNATGHRRRPRVTCGDASLIHEALVLLFRNRPELAAELVRDVLHVDLPSACWS